MSNCTALHSISFLTAQPYTKICFLPIFKHHMYSCQLQCDQFSDSLSITAQPHTTICSLPIFKPQTYLCQRQWIINCLITYLQHRPTQQSVLCLYSSLKVRLHRRCGSGVFAERCDFNRNLPIFSNRHRWRQRQHLMCCRLCKQHLRCTYDSDNGCTYLGSLS